MNRDGTRFKKKETILLIEDEEIVSKVTMEMLSKLGYKVLTACNGIEALHAYEKQHHDIDLILLDLQMPRMDGTETYRHLKKLNPNAKIIVSTATGGDDFKLDQFDLQQGGYLRKPYLPRELAAEIERVLQPR